MRKLLSKPLGLLAVAAFAFLGADGVWAQAAAKPPVEAFFQNPAFTDAQFSPNGRHIAVGVSRKGGRTQLVVIETETLAAKAIAAPTDSDISQFHWVNDDRLLFTVRDRESAPGDLRFIPGLFAVQRDGSGFRRLPGYRLAGATGEPGAEHVFVSEDSWSLGKWYGTNLKRLDTSTGKVIGYNRPGRTGSWVLDPANEPRVAVTYEETEAAVQYLDPADNKWQQLMKFPLFKGEGFYPMALLGDGSLYGVARKGTDKSGLYRYDLNKRMLDPEPVAASSDFDFTGHLVRTKEKVLGVRYLTDAWATAWLDPGMKEIQAKVDKLLPGTVNRIDVPWRAEVPHVLVRSYSDVDPGRYFLYHPATGKLTELGFNMREIDPRTMARSDLVRYKARDGLSIPAWLTLPADAKGKKLPLIVLVHGGPWMRGGVWMWNAQAQFLASRGYAVLEPEFRGSTGFGFDHYSKGFRQWGLAMQNDLADGARWAIDKGIVDGSRICIAGASYGGYAALMGLVNDPDLFRCGFQWVGVTDIDLMYSVTWSDFSAEYKEFGMPVLVGDKEKDAAQLKAASPIEQASRIKQPLLLAYGGADRRVPIVHGIKFRDAVQKTNPNVEWIEYTEEGHGWQLVKNRVDFWTRVEKFLERHIGAK
jgi:dipeptidyl aminopeptidase/acylaminoacyl peptidase